MVKAPEPLAPPAVVREPPKEVDRFLCPQPPPPVPPRVAPAVEPGLLAHTLLGNQVVK